MSLDSTEQKVSKTRGKIFNTPSSNKSSKLNANAGKVTNISKSALGTVTSVGRTVAKIAGNVGLKGVEKALTGSTNTKYYPSNSELQSGAGETTGLKSFYMKFGGRSQNLVDHIDTLNTFECEFEFSPGIEAQQSGKTPSDVINVMEQLKVKNPQWKYDYDKGTDLSTGTNEDTETNNILDLGMIIQKVTIPNISIPDGEAANNMMGNFKTHGTFVFPDSNTLQMDVLNLKNPISEKLFYPWMREVTTPIWAYDNEPFTTATITIDFSEHADVSYVFTRCRPTQFMTLQPSQDPSTNFTRQVTFTFDFMFICPGKQKTWTPTSTDYTTEKIFTSQLATHQGESLTDKITKLGNAGLFAGGNILKF